MIYSNKIQKAIKFSIQVHEVDPPKRQLRKGKEIAYITHPLTAGLILARAGASEDVIAAGILHDTIEDSDDEHKVTKERLAEEFGDRVAELVDAVTENNRTLSWGERKEAAFMRVTDYSNDMVLVKSADVISNTTELYEDFIKDGIKTFDRFNAPADMSLIHTEKLIDALRKKWPESPLHTDLGDIAPKVAAMYTAVKNGKVNLGSRGT